MEEVVKPLLRRNEQILQSIPSREEGDDDTPLKKDASVSATMPLTPDSGSYEMGGRRNANRERILRSSPDIHYLRKTKTILQKTKLVELY